MTRQWIALSTGFPMDLETLTLPVEHRYSWVVLLTISKREGWNGTVNGTVIAPLLEAFAGLSKRRQGVFFRALTALGWVEQVGPNYVIQKWDRWQKDPGSPARAKKARDKKRHGSARDENRSEVALTGTGTGTEPPPPPNEGEARRFALAWAGSRSRLKDGRLKDLASAVHRDRAAESSGSRSIDWVNQRRRIKTEDPSGFISTERMLGRAARRAAP